MPWLAFHNNYGLQVSVAVLHTRWTRTHAADSMAVGQRTAGGI